MGKFLASLALLMLSVHFCAVATAAGSPQPIPRGSARIIGLVVPDFPDTLVRDGSPLEIPLILAVDDDGHVTEVILESSPSTIVPREAMRRGIEKGVVGAVIQFDPDGNVTEIVRMFQWPPRVFERAVREAVMQWKAAPEDDAVLKGEPFRACFDVTFTAR